MTLPQKTARKTGDFTPPFRACTKDIRFPKRLAGWGEEGGVSPWFQLVLAALGGGGRGQGEGCREHRGARRGCGTQRSAQTEALSAVSAGFLVAALGVRAGGMRAQSWTHGCGGCLAPGSARTGTRSGDRQARSRSKGVSISGVCVGPREAPCSAPGAVVLTHVLPSGSLGPCDGRGLKGPGGWLPPRGSDWRKSAEAWRAAHKGEGRGGVRRLGGRVRPGESLVLPASAWAGTPSLDQVAVGAQAGVHGSWLCV